MSVSLYNPEGKEGAGVDLVFEAITFDAVVRVNHRRQAQVTRQPVEEGADISDNTKAESREVELSEAIVSNFPALLFAPLRRSRTAAQAAWQQLEAWRKQGTPLTLVTEDEVYDTVVIEDMSKPDDVDHANSMHATIRLVEIRTVETTTTKAPKPKKGRDRAAAKADKGQRPKKEATPSLRDTVLDHYQNALPAPPPL